MITKVKLSSKIIALILSLVSITVILESLVSYFENKELIKRNVIEKFHVANNDNEEKINEYFDQLQVSLTTIFASPVLQKKLERIQNHVNSKEQIRNFKKFINENCLIPLKNNYTFENIYLLNHNNKTLINLKNDEEFRNIDNQSIALHRNNFHVNQCILEGNHFFNYVTLPIKNLGGELKLVCKIKTTTILRNSIFRKSNKEYITLTAYKATNNIFYFLNQFHLPESETEKNYTRGSFCRSPNNKIGQYNAAFPVGNAVYIDEENKKIIASWKGIKILGIGLMCSQDAIQAFKGQKTFNNYSIIFGALILIITLLFSYLFSRILTYPLLRLKEVLKLVSKGILPDKLNTPLKDEIGEMVHIMNRIVESMKKTAVFADKIGQGNFTENFTPISDKDKLGKSLLSMRQSLVDSKQKDDTQSWVIKGVNEVGDLLRLNDSIEELGDAVLEYCCSRVNAVQGTFYNVIEDVTQPSLEITSTYAYNRKKYIKKSFQFGEGLVGQAAIEKDKIYRTEIPENYIEITSGLIGEQKPTALLVMPLLSENKVQGVLEFCSFEKFTSGQLQFIEEVSKIIARTIFNINNNEKTKKLLLESQRLGSELQLQQEELRQNSVKLQKTGEQVKQSNKELENQIKEVKNAQNRTRALLENAAEVITIYDKNGLIKYVSPSVETILGYRQEELLGISDLKFIDAPSQKKFKRLLDTIKIEEFDGVNKIRINYFKKTGDKITLEATAKNLLNNPAINGIVINCTDITERIRAEQEQRKRGQMQALSENSLDLILRMNKSGNIFYVNPTVKHITGFDTTKFVNKKIETSSFDSRTIAALSLMLTEVSNTEKKVSREITIKALSGEKTMLVNGIPEFDEGKEITTVLFVAHDITERKQQEIELKTKNTKINDSINYAEEIQKSIIPNSSIINKTFKEGFVLFKPKDIVSGDFPFFQVKNNDTYIAVVDCTGHGVPGAMISFVGYFLLKNIIESHENLNAGQALDLLDLAVTQTLKQNEESSKLKDGMDLSLIRYNKETNTIDYAGANRPLIRVDEDGVINELKANKFPIGGGASYTNKTSFTNNTFIPKENEKIFMFSDGYPDQFNKSNEKFSTRRMKSIVTNSKHKTLDDLHQEFKKELNEWMREVKQTDDILLLGLKF